MLLVAAVVLMEYSPALFCFIIYFLTCNHVAANTRHSRSSSGGSSSGGSSSSNNVASVTADVGWFGPGTKPLALPTP